MFELLYPKFFEDVKNYKIKFKVFGSDSIMEKELEAYDLKAIWGPRMLTQDPYRVEFKPDCGTAIIRIKTFYFNGNNKPFFQFLEEVFVRIKKDKIKNVIIDLRANSGGDPVAAGRLFSYLISKPLRYFADVYSKEYAHLAEPIQPAVHHFNGNLYVIIDGGGVSTAGHLVSLIKYHKTGMLVGSELGSTFTCNDNCIIKPLSHTGLTVKIARSTFTTAVSGMKADRGVMPDYPIPFSIKDFTNGIDSEMEFILKIIEQRNK